MTCGTGSGRIGIILPDTATNRHSGPADSCPDPDKIYFTQVTINFYWKFNLMSKIMKIFTTMMLTLKIIKDGHCSKATRTRWRKCRKRWSRWWPAWRGQPIWRSVPNWGWRRWKRGGQTRTWRLSTSSWARKTDKLCSTSRAEREPGRRPADMDWPSSTPGQTRGSIHSQCGLLSPGTGCQRV